MEKWLNRVWYGDAAGGALLRPLSLLYGAVAAARRGAYRAGLLKRIQVDCPVIVVGNLTVGGTGKTPLVAWLTQQLKRSGLRPAIVSRGYGSEGGEPRSVESTSDWREMGDEPTLLHRVTGAPVFVSADRVAAAQAAVRHGANIIVSDDGLQHLRLARNCEIVVIDGARGFGNARLLPAGPLREPVQALARADVIVVNGDAGPKVIEQIQAAQGRPVVTMRLHPTSAWSLGSSDEHRALESWRGKPVHGVAGIGNPARFFQTLRASGIEVVEHPFPDHHAFTAADLAFDDGLPVLMTEKDAVRAGDFADPRMWYVPVTATFTDADTRTLMEPVRAKR